MTSRWTVRTKERRQGFRRKIHLASSHRRMPQGIHLPWWWPARLRHNKLPQLRQAHCRCRKLNPLRQAGDASSVMPGPDGSAAPSNPAGETDEEASIGAWFYGKPTIRHDGVEVSGVQRGGAAEDIGIR